MFLLLRNNVFLNPRLFFSNFSRITIFTKKIIENRIMNNLMNFLKLISRTFSISCFHTVSFQIPKKKNVIINNVFQ